MKTFKTVYAACLVALCSLSTADADELDQKRVGIDGQSRTDNLTEFFQPKELSPFTSMRVKVMPDRGTRLIFPFILTDANLAPRLNIFNANDSVFTITQTQDQINGQPVLDIQYIESPEDIRTRLQQMGRFQPILGQIQISVGGYYIAIEVESTLNLNDVVSNYVFQLSEEEREHLIELAIDRYREALDLEYQEKFESLDDEAEKLTVNYIADIVSKEPDTKNLRLDTESDDKKIEIYIDRFEYYNDRYSVIHFEVTNQSTRGLAVTDIEFFGLDNDIEDQLTGNSNCADWIERRETVECVFVSQNMDMHRFSKMKTEISTEDETWSLIW